jgi:hypothetical protein
LSFSSSTPGGVTAGEICARKAVVEEVENEEN